MKFGWRHLWVLCVLCGASSCLSLDREAFSITNYDLNLQIEPEQHRLGVRGKITLRNDTTTPQKIAVLQISSSLDWRAVRAGDKMLQFVTQPYTSDVDHTGGLSEAIVTLPHEVAPKGTVDLNIAYEGVILLDATRLTRIGTPEDMAKNSDWDRIDENFTALRGAGYVAWYPIATESANLSEGYSLFEVLGRWKVREARPTIRMQIALPMEYPSVPQILLGGMTCRETALVATNQANQRATADCLSQRPDAPTLLIADYQVLEEPGIEVHYLEGHDAAATNFAESAKTALSLVRDWFKNAGERAKIADVPFANVAPFESGVLLLTPLRSENSSSAGLTAAHQLTHASFRSFRPWIEEGLAHFAQALYLEQQKGRQAALDYMRAHRTALTQVESSAVGNEDDNRRSLVSTLNEELYRSKAMCVWWMLRDMIGDAALKRAIASYKPEQDNDPTYMPHLIATQTQRDLSWFLDDWLYHDRGLPDFRVESAFSRKASQDNYLVTLTIENLGAAGAEVPIKVQFEGGDLSQRVAVRAKTKAIVRVATPKPPKQIVVNDGSVPENDLSNNTFKVAAAVQ